MILFSFPILEFQTTNIIEKKSVITKLSLVRLVLTSSDELKNTKNRLRERNVSHPVSSLEINPEKLFEANVVGSLKKKQKKSRREGEGKIKDRSLIGNERARENRVNCFAIRSERCMWNWIYGCACTRGV